MTMMVFLNELSAPQGRLDIHQGKAVMNALVGVLKAVKTKRSNMVLHSASPMKGMALGDLYSVGQWCNDPESKERWLWLRALQNKSPFEVGLENSIEYKHDKVKAEGLGLSHLFGGLAVSFAHGEIWDDSTVSLVKHFLREDDSGGAVLEEETVETFHACHPDHVTSHADWLETACVTPVVDGEDLWNRRGDLFPHLDFLPRTESQVRKLLPGHPWLRAVADRLKELDSAVAGWQPATMRYPDWCNVTPEGENRKKLCWFNDIDGKKRLFDLHARFTPGCGRLHLRLDPTNSKARVAHIGDKIL